MPINPKGITEQMMYSTVLIQTAKGTGTGYFFRFEDGENNYPVVITNKHVINNNTTEKVTLFLHTKDSDDFIHEQKISLEWEGEWLFHPKYDLCCLPLVPIINFIYRKTTKIVKYIALD